MPVCTVLGDIVDSSFGTYCSPTLVTNVSSVGTNQSKGILSSHPNIVYHICHGFGIRLRIAPTDSLFALSQCSRYMLPPILSLLTNRSCTLWPFIWLLMMVIYFLSLFTPVTLWLKLVMVLFSLLHTLALLVVPLDSVSSPLRMFFMYVSFSIILFLLDNYVG